MLIPPFKVTSPLSEKILEVSSKKTPKLSVDPIPAIPSIVIVAASFCSPNDKISLYSFRLQPCQ